MKYSVRSLNYSQVTEGECRGFFRIPQVSQFVTHAHRKYSESQVSRLSASITQVEQLADLLPIYEEAGEILMNKSESCTLARHSNPTYKRLTSPPLVESTPATQGTPKTEPKNIVVDDLSASMQELVRFVTVSAMLGDFPEQLKSHEREYNALVDRHPETYSVFREQNPTYQSIRSLLRKEDRFYLAKLMLWRVYVWGLEIEVQKWLRLQEAKNAQEFHRKWNEVRDELGERALTVTTYGGNFYPHIQKDLEAMQGIWNGGLRLWSEWKCHLPREFLDAHKAIASAKMPIYTHGNLSRMLLLGDLVCAGYVVSPTEKELADLMVKANSGAIQGLHLLGYDCHTRDQVATAIQRIRQYLNVGLLKPVKERFGDGEVDLFDVEHILCKIARKQGRRGSKSPVWHTKLSEQGLKRKADRE